MAKNPRQPKRAPKEAVSKNHVAGNSVSDTKKKTAPLKKDSATTADKEEGKMNNGELGGGMKEAK